MAWAFTRANGAVQIRVAAEYYLPDPYNRGHCHLKCMDRGGKVLWTRYDINQIKTTFIVSCLQLTFIIMFDHHPMYIVLCDC